jgi:hypothetical protein
MEQSGCRLRLAMKARPRFGIALEVGHEHFQGDRATDHFIVRGVDNPHGTAPDAFEDAKPANARRN